MNRYAVMIVICIISIMIFAGYKSIIYEDLDTDKIAEELSLDKDQIAEYMIMEEQLRELHDSIDRLTYNLVNEARICLENKEYEKAGIILEWSGNMEQMRIEESIKLQNTFTSCLNDEQKLKYFIIRHESKKALGNDTLINKLHKEDK